jgi:hypothetical protein
MVKPWKDDMEPDLVNGDKSWRWCEITLDKENRVSRLLCCWKREVDHEEMETLSGCFAVGEKADRKTMKRLPGYLAVQRQR